MLWKAPIINSRKYIIKKCLVFDKVFFNILWKSYSWKICNYWLFGENISTIFTVIGPLNIFFNIFDNLFRKKINLKNLPLLKNIYKNPQKYHKEIYLKTHFYSLDGKKFKSTFYGPWNKIWKINFIYPW